MQDRDNSIAPITNESDVAEVKPKKFVPGGYVPDATQIYEDEPLFSASPEGDQLSKMHEDLPCICGCGFHKFIDNGVVDSVIEHCQSNRT